MIIIQLTGGLGNQLFQYAFARNLNLTHGIDIKFDINHFFANHQRSFELDKLKIEVDVATAEEINRVRLENSLLSLAKRKVNTLIKPYYRKSIIEEKSFAYDPNLLKVNTNAYISGYFQSEKYFTSIETFLRKEIVPKENILSSSFYSLQSDMQKSMSVSVHVRRGDYINNPESYQAHGVCEMDYYTSALNLIKGKTNNPIFYIFSDDIRWCIENFTSEHPFVFITETKSAIEDLFLMASCKHNIIANSSFSWWGAWLNPNANKITIAPKKWFNNRKENTQDLIPEPWIRL